METDFVAVGDAAIDAPAGALPASLNLAVVALDRVLPITERIVRVLAYLAVVGAGGACVILGMLASRQWPLSGIEVALVVIAAALLAAPAAVLIAYRSALLRFKDAADRIRALPTLASEGGAQILGAMEEIRTEMRRSAGGTVGAMRQLLAVTRDYDEQVREYASLAAAANPGFVAATLAAAVCVAIEVGLAALLLLWAALG